MGLDDYITAEQRVYVLKLDDLARESSKLPKDSKSRYSADQSAFKYINSLPVGIIKQRFVAEYYRLRSEYEKSGTNK